MTETIQNLPNDAPINYDFHCKLCGRETKCLYGHHLKPRKFRRRMEVTPKMKLCQDCTKMVHAIHNLHELAEVYNTEGKLKESFKLQGYINWVRNKPIGVVTHPKRAWLGGKYE